MFRLLRAGGSHLYELHGVLRREVMIRRLKQDVLGELPPKIRSVVRLPHPPTNRCATCCRWRPRVSHGAINQLSGTGS